MKAILAVNNLGFIGLHGGIPWKCKEDFKHFKGKTLESADASKMPTLLVGYNTAQKLPPLKGREVIIDHRGVEYYDLSVDWLIGGKKTYEKYSPLLTELHISHIDDNTVGDCLFPDLSNLNPACKIFNYYFKADV